MKDLMIEATSTARSRGERMTSQRRLILESLTALGGHPTAEEVYRDVRQRDGSVNPSTVYRTLRWLESAGLVSHCHLDMGPDGEHSERYDPVTPVEHHHFICTACGRVTEFEAPGLEAVKTDFSAKQGDRIVRATLNLFGVCGACIAGRDLTG